MRQAQNVSLSPHERKKRKRARYKRNKCLAKDLASGNVDGKSASGSSLKRQTTQLTTPGRLSSSTSQPVHATSASGHQVTYSEAVEVRPLVISSRESGRSLGKLDLLKLESLVQEKMIMENPGFPVKNSGSNFNRGTIRLHCLDQRSHEYMKSLINSTPDLGYLAQSLYKLPRLKKFGARVSAAIEVGSFIKLLCQCNPALDPSKLHIKGVAPLSNGKTIIVGAEPEMAALIKKREGRFCFLISDIILRDFRKRGPTCPRSSTLRATSPSFGTQVQQGEGPALAVSPIAPCTITSLRAAGSGRAPAGPDRFSATPSVTLHHSKRQLTGITKHGKENLSNVNEGLSELGGAMATPPAIPLAYQELSSRQVQVSFISQVRCFEGKEQDPTGSGTAVFLQDLSGPRESHETSNPKSISISTSPGAGSKPNSQPVSNQHKKRRHRRGKRKGKNQVVKNDGK